MVIILSVMVKAIRSNMVNRALLERGRWWNPFFYYWCEKAEYQASSGVQMGYYSGRQLSDGY